MKYLPFLLLLPLFVNGQTYSDFYQQSVTHNASGMYVLGGWAATNMALGAYGWSKQSGKMKYFHQMNLFWNTVNLTIAGIGLYNNLNPEMAGMNFSQMLSEHMKMERIYLINAGLDVFYMSAGWFMLNRSGKVNKNADLLGGYGYSVILQGGFLFIFDLVMYGVQRNFRLQHWPQEVSFALNPTGFQLTYMF